jgi:murein DD-endopeptidase MepM/ murein hydrolase activator NlpD
VRPLYRCRRALVLGAVVTNLVVCASPLPAAAAGTSTPEWTRPVGGAVVQPFGAPASPYAPGHRGVDFAAAPGTPVRAAGDGVVTFAGAVADTLHVVVAHGSSLRTSYSFLARIDVRVGQHVARGFIVGLAGGAGPGHPVGELHFGLRIGERYVDPMVLFAPPDLSKLVHLVPAGLPAGDSGPSVGDERRAVRADLELSDDGGGGVGGLVGDAVDGAVDAAGDLASGAADAVISGLSGAAAAGNEAARGLQRTLSAVVDGLRAGGAAAVHALARTPAGQTLHDLVETGRRLLAWFQSRLRCSSDDPAADGTGGSGHMLLDVGGITTARSAPDEASSGIDVAKLGYRTSEVAEFSYKPHSDLYTKGDTYEDLIVAALAMRDQLQIMQQEHPGREVDLIAHSQGGVVIDVFLQYVYKASDPRYPPIGSVVTLSSPHRGAPSATAGAKIRSGLPGRALADGIDRLPLPIPPTDALSVQQVAESSDLMKHLWDHKLPEQIDYTSIGSPFDYVVPGNQTQVPGATNVMVPVYSADAHSAIATDPRALQVVRSALERRPPPCVGFVAGELGAAAPVVITRIEHTIGDTVHRADNPLAGGTP